MTLNISGARLREERERHALTQGELAERAGLSLWTVHRAEHTGNVSAKTARALAAALEVAPGELREEELVVDLSDGGFTALQERADPESLREEVAESEAVYERVIAHGATKEDFDMERGGYAARLAALAQAEGGDFDATRRAIARALSTAEKAFMTEFARVLRRLREQQS